MAPSAPNEVWAGTGETFYIRPYTSPGNGVYKSLDRGTTWTHMGLKETARIAVSSFTLTTRTPYTSAPWAMPTRPKKSAGVFRTTDGGKNWERILFVNENTGCSDLNMDPGNPKKLFAAHVADRYQTLDAE